MRMANHLLYISLVSYLISATIPPTPMLPSILAPVPPCTLAPLHRRSVPIRAIRGQNKFLFSLPVLRGKFFQIQFIPSKCFF